MISLHEPCIALLLVSMLGGCLDFAYRKRVIGPMRAMSSAFECVSRGLLMPQVGCAITASELNELCSLRCARAKALRALPGGACRM